MRRQSRIVLDRRFAAAAAPSLPTSPERPSPTSSLPVTSTRAQSLVIHLRAEKEERRSLSPHRCQVAPTQTQEPLPRSRRLWRKPLHERKEAEIGLRCSCALRLLFVAPQRLGGEGRVEVLVQRVCGVEVVAADEVRGGHSDGLHAEEAEGAEEGVQGRHVQDGCALVHGTKKVHEDAVVGSRDGKEKHSSEEPGSSLEGDAENSEQEQLERAGEVDGCRRRG